MAQGKSPRNPLAFASVLYPGRCLAVELANTEPTGSSQQGTPRGLRTTAELSRPGASSFSSAASTFPPSCQALVVCLPLH